MTPFTRLVILQRTLLVASLLVGLLSPGLTWATSGLERLGDVKVWRLTVTWTHQQHSVDDSGAEQDIYLNGRAQYKLLPESRKRKARTLFVWKDERKAVPTGQFNTDYRRIRRDKGQVIYREEGGAIGWKEGGGRLSIDLATGEFRMHAMGSQVGSITFHIGPNPAVIKPAPFTVGATPPGQDWTGPLPASGFRIVGERNDVPCPIPGFTDQPMHVSFVLEPDQMDDDLSANPGGPYSVLRGGEVMLDGSKSEGRIDSYTWTFEPMADESRGAGRPAKGHKDGEQVSAVFLQKTKVTLEVKNATRSAKASTIVSVTPRAFTTPINPDTDERVFQLPAGSKDVTVRQLTLIPLMGVENVAAALNMCGGEELADVSHWREADHILHFDGDRAHGDLWENQAYTLRQVHDKGGPYDQHWYVEEILFSVKRRAYLSPYFQENGPVPSRYTRMNWYRANVAERAKREAEQREYAADDLGPMDYTPNDYLEAVRQHERAHSTAILKALQKDDPAKTVEKYHGSDKEALKEEIHVFLNTRETELTNLGIKVDSSTNEIWNGQILLWDNQGSEWLKHPDKVTGE